MHHELFFLALVILAFLEMALVGMTLVEMTSVELIHQLIMIMMNLIPSCRAVDLSSGLYLEVGILLVGLN